MSKQNPNNDKKPGKMGNNNYWLIALLFTAVISFNIILYSSNKGETTTTEGFFRMAENREIEKVEIINEKVVQIFLNEKGKSNNDVKSNALTQNAPQFSFQIGDIGNFENRINEMNDNAGSVILDPVHVTKQNYLLPILSWLIPLFIIIGLWVYFMRRVGGGGGGGGAQIFNIGKSKASLFDANSKVNVTFQDVAGLDEAKAVSYTHLTLPTKRIV